MTHQHEKLSNKEEKDSGSEETKRYIRRRRIVSLVSLLILIVLFAVVTVKIGVPLVQMVGNPSQFRDWVNSHSLWGRLAFVGMVVLGGGGHHSR